MEKFTTLTGQIAYLKLSNIDTDMIIPKQYLKTIKRTGLGKFLFAEMRYDQTGEVINDFILNQQPNTKILLAGENFGCGSSREHAPWALLDFGIKAIIAPGFADIFYNNCFKNGILPIKLSQAAIQTLILYSTLTINLGEQSVKGKEHTFYFAIDEHRKTVLLNGLDDIEKVLEYKSTIAAFEKKHFEKCPWLIGGKK